MAEYIYRTDKDIDGLVRCGDCIYWEPATPSSGNCNRALIVTAYINDYCSYGERRASDDKEAD